jgi:hypothetical protein
MSRGWPPAVWTRLGLSLDCYPCSACCVLRASPRCPGRAAVRELMVLLGQRRGVVRLTCLRSAAPLRPWQASVAAPKACVSAVQAFSRTWRAGQCGPSCILADPLNEILTIISAAGPLGLHRPHASRTAPETCTKTRTGPIPLADRNSTRPQPCRHDGDHACDHPSLGTCRHHRCGGVLASRLGAGIRLVRQGPGRAGLPGALLGLGNQPGTRRGSRLPGQYRSGVVAEPYGRPAGTSPRASTPTTGWASRRALRQTQGSTRNLLAPTGHGPTVARAGSPSALVSQP